MLNKSGEQWTAKKMVKMINRNEITFDNPIQRNPCWNDAKKSLFINTMLEDYPTPHIFANTGDNRKFDLLDGKQRTLTVQEFMRNTFKLTKAAKTTTLDNGDEYNLFGKRYCDLPEELQDRINDYVFGVTCFNNITEAQVVEIFHRINSGKPFTSIELTRVCAVSRNMINEIGKHEIFTTDALLDENGIKKYMNEDIVIKSWILLYDNDPSFNSNYMQNLMEQTAFTDEQVIEMFFIYDKMLETYRVLSNADNSEKVLSEMKKKNNILSLVPVFKQSISDGIGSVALAQWIVDFFGSDNGASIDREYNDTLDSGTTGKGKLQKRLNAIINHYNAALKQGNTVAVA